MLNSDQMPVADLSFIVCYSVSARGQHMCTSEVYDKPTPANSAWVSGKSCGTAVPSGIAEHPSNWLLNQ